MISVRWPWTPQGPALGFSPSATSWLPRPADSEDLAHSVQATDQRETLSLYRQTREARRRLKLGSGGLRWLDTGHGAGVIAFENPGIDVVLNMSQAPVDLSAGSVLMASCPEAVQNGTGASRLAPNAAVWLRPEPR